MNTETKGVAHESDVDDEVVDVGYVQEAKHAYYFPNGERAVIDQRGRQISHLQGRPWRDLPADCEVHR